jgi:deoxyribose-phosphate aldolase
MYIDFAIIDTETDEATAKKIVLEILPYNINSITVPYYLIKPLKSLINDSITLSCLIDYPLGISDNKTRKCAIEQAIKAGATGIDIVMPQNLAANRKYDKIREDIKNANSICTPLNIKLKYILEYRFFDHQCLKKLCEIFETHNISNVYPSTGYFLDNLADNILASLFLYKNSKELNVICSGNMWTEKHFDTINKSGLFGFRTTSQHSLQNFINFNAKNKNGV